MKGSYLGPSYSNNLVEEELTSLNANYEILKEDELIEKAVDDLLNNKCIGWFHGKMEFGPRALGARSILGNPLDPELQKTLNLKVKFRESFRPFAPSVLEEDVSNQFELNNTSPYMLLVAPVKKENCKFNKEKEVTLRGLEKINFSRSSLPAVTHVDYTSRVQTVSHRTNPRYYNLIKTLCVATAPSG